MLRFTTETGSQYELDTEGSRIRRMSNAEGREATPRQGPDGEWKTYLSCGFPYVGGECVIVWRVDDTEDGPLSRCTFTSLVTEVEPCG